MKNKLSIVISLTFLVLLIGTISQQKVDASIPGGPDVSRIYVTLSAAGTSDYCDVDYQGRLDDGDWVYSFIHEVESPWSFSSSGTISEQLNYNWVYLKVRVHVYGSCYYCETWDNPVFTKESGWFGNEYGTTIVSASLNLNSDYPFDCPEQ